MVDKTEILLEISRRGVQAQCMSENSEKITVVPAMLRLPIQL